MSLFALAILSSSILLFLVEPMVARYILPWFGGAPSVWTTCMLFFQIFLLGGYAYAHGIAARLTPRRQAQVHGALLAASLCFLPIIPNDFWKPASPNFPELRIVLLLAATLGLPFALLSSSAPLHQHWFSRSFPGRSPWRLYALSNAGSMAGLLLYPLLLEPQLTLRSQAMLWSFAYGLFILASGWCAWRMFKLGPAGECETIEKFEISPPQSAIPGSPGPHGSTGPHSHRLSWILLAACGSVMLLATTNRMCQEVAVIPFLWILPLALYLLSFILCFESERWYRRPVWGAALLLGCVAAVWLMVTPLRVHILSQIGILALTLLACCMVCHGELARLKPPAERLTAYYLSIALGGALGGLFVNLIAPRIFSDYWEYEIGLFLTVLLFGNAALEGTSLLRARWFHWLLFCAWVGGLVLMTCYFAYVFKEHNTFVIAKTRNFYGVLQVTQQDTGQENAKRTMKHGPIDHGVQFLEPARRRWPTAYYGPGSGVFLACSDHPRRQERDPAEPDRGGGNLRIGVVGLGAGTLACLAGPGDAITFYEINPEVIRLARQYFTYLADCPARCEVVAGDARISLEREWAANPAGNQFDVLALDAFNGDAPPVHLLTRESFAVYWRHLRPDGILAVDISNHHVNLAPVVAALARELGKSMVLVINRRDSVTAGTFPSRWALVTSNTRFLNNPEVQAAADKDAATLRPILWTDQYSNLLRVIQSY